jgi:hypothetical protein
MVFTDPSGYNACIHTQRVDWCVGDWFNSTQGDSARGGTDAGPGSGGAYESLMGMNAAAGQYMNQSYWEGQSRIPRLQADFYDPNVHRASPTYGPPRRGTISVTVHYTKVGGATHHQANSNPVAKRLLDRAMRYLSRTPAGRYVNKQIDKQIDRGIRLVKNAWRSWRGTPDAAKETAGQVGSSFGRNSVGAAEHVLGEVVQSGGNKITNFAANALNRATGSSLTRREWGRAAEALKHEFGLRPNHHGKITEYGHYLDKSGNVLGNLLDYL